MLCKKYRQPSQVRNIHVILFRKNEGVPESTQSSK
nr:unnamed protein product [Callosobruchus chinensis]